MTLVDTNALLDLATDDSSWADWSTAALEAASVEGPLFINDIVYAEFSVGYDRIDDVDAFFAKARISIVPFAREALFLAGKAFARYRAAGGIRPGVLPDFFIGAHAAVSGVPLLTRDPRRYRTYFPTVTLIAPDEYR